MYFRLCIKQFFWVVLMVVPMSLMAAEFSMARNAIEKQIASYRNVLQTEPKNEVARDGLADMAVSILLLIEKAEEIDDQKEVVRLKEIIMKKLPDTGWRIEDRAKKEQKAALVSAAILYRQGLLVDKNREKSCGFYATAANQADAYANYRSALCVIGLDVDKMAAYMATAAHLGHAIAQEYLARICLSNTEWQCMMRWAKPAAEKGRLSAMSLMAWAYTQGKGVNKDAAKAVEYYLEAAEGGNLLAQNNLGQLYEEGVGVSKNLSKAVSYYRLAAESGFAQAQYNLGRVYLFGIGVTKNKREAVKWLNKSKQQGVEEAVRLLGFKGE